MLTRLTLTNIAIVKSASLTFSPGFTVITGESGAGKSIFLEGMALISGGTGTDSWIRFGETSGEIEAEFDVSQVPVPEPLAALIEGDPHVIVTRQWTKSKSSTCRINGQTVTAKFLKDTIQPLLSIASQHHYLAVMKESFQRGIVDQWGKIDLATYQTIWHEIQSLTQTLAKMTEGPSSDFLAFQLAELNALDLKPGEELTLIDAKKNYHQNKKLRSKYIEFSGHIDTAVSAMAGARRSSTELPDPDAMASITTACDDIHALLDGLTEKVATLIPAHHPIDIDAIESRLDQLYRAKTKYRVAHADQLCEIRDKISDQLTTIQDQETTRKSRESALHTATEKATALANQISAARSAAAETLSTEITTHLHALGFSHPQFVISITPSPTLTETGHDSIQFLFSANPGIPPNDIKKIASGGELSRLMLAILPLTATSGPVMVFDEIDAGTGGMTAVAIGKALEFLGKTQQVIAITHLPQVAKYATSHWVIEKITAEDTTVCARLLNDDRAHELNRMVGMAVPFPASPPNPTG